MRSHTGYKSPVFAIRCCSILSKQEVSVTNLDKHDEAYLKHLKECPQCGTMHMKPKFCSKSCAAKWNNQQRGKPKRQCHQCGTETKNPKYCSMECSGKGRTKPLTPERINEVRAIKNEAWQRYMAKRKNQTPDDADIRLMQEIYKNCPEGYEVDHKIPISKGGLHHQDNLQYLTISENRHKSNKILAGI